MKEDQTFINYLADQIIEKYGLELHDIIIVFPNRRAGLFLQEALRSKLGKASWLPEIVAVESAFSKWSGIKLADPIDLIFELFNIHFQLEGKSDENLSVFAPYGFQMLRDFEEVDHYLIDREKIFSYLSEAKALEIWHADGSPLSAYEQQYLHFFQLLTHYHEKLHAYMAEKFLGYYGFIARKLAELKPEELLHRIAFKKVVFAGFNVLTKAEEVVFSELFKFGKANFYWDIDQYLLEKNMFGYHEGGQHLRKLFQRNPGLKTSRFISKLQNDKKEIHFIGVSSHVGQAFALSSNLTAYNSVAANTAVVLADEKLLLPVLNLIPRKVDHFNVTMGLPFKQGAVFRFVYTLLEVGVFRQKSGRNDVFTLTQFTAIVQNELVRIFFNAEDFNQLLQLRNALATNGDMYVSLSQIKRFFTTDQAPAYAFIEQLYAILHGESENMLALIYVLLHQIIVQAMPQKQDVKVSLILQQLAAYKKLVNRFSVLFRKREGTLDFKSLLLLFTNVSKAYQLSLSGEPLRGLQLMGMLETRNLDFQTIHLLSANEGNLPLEKSRDSLLPADIRRQFGLPSALDKQAIYAFHFYHLLQHASKIYLYYNAEPDPLGGGEMSRYMLQLKFELSKINPEIVIFEHDFNFDIPPQQTQKEVVVNKSEAVLERIRQKLASGLSPTALSRYLSCSLKFYLTDIVGIREFQQPDGTIALNTLGTVVHQALELLYQPYTSRILSEEHIQQMRLRMEDVLTMVFEMNYPGGIALHGYNRLAFVVAKKFIEKVLNHEKQSIVKEQNEIMILSQELTLSHVIHIQEIPVVLKGTIDRVDRFNGITRIIDYKTGAVNKKDVEVVDQDDFFDEKKSKALQLAVYQWLFIKNQEHSMDSSVIAGILSLRSISEGFLQLTSKTNFDQSDFENAVERTIGSIVAELLDVTNPFNQTTNRNSCKHCVFNGFCLRQ